MPASAQNRLVPVPWRELLEQQEQVLTRGQALRGGLTGAQWDWRLTRGGWQAVLPGVAVAHTGTVTARERAWAGVLHAGAGAALSADAALVELGMRLLDPAVVDVAVPLDRRVRPQVYAPHLDAVRLRPHRVTALSELVHPVRQPQTVRLPVAVLNAAAWATTDRAAEWRVAAAVQQRLVLAKDLRSALAGLGRLPRGALLTAVLDDVEVGAHAASELDFLRFLRTHRLPAPDRLQRPLRWGTVRYLDVWWERQRVSAEIDGAHHRTVGTWDDDALRSNDVAVAERHDRVLLLRFTRGNLRHDGPRVAAQLRAALR